MNGTFKQQLDRWALGLTRACVQGGAIAVKAYFGVAGLSTLPTGINALTWQQGAGVFLAGMAYHFADYLASNPLPDVVPTQQQTSDTTMKKTIAVLLIASACLCAQAQTNSNTSPTEQTFLQSFEGYFGSFNTNNASTFGTNDTFDVWTGAEYVNNQNTAASLGISWNAFKVSQETIGLESVTRNAGINGVILSQSAGVNLQKVYVDTKFEAYVDGGYDFSLKKPVAEVGARVFKALTANTYAGIGIGERFGSGQVSSFPVLSVFAGFKF